MFRSFGIVTTPPVPLDVVRKFLVCRLAGADHGLIVVLVVIRRRVLTCHAATATVVPYRIQKRNFLAGGVEPRVAHRIIVGRRNVTLPYVVRPHRRHPEGNVSPHEGANHLALVQVKFTHAGQQGRGTQRHGKTLFAVLANAFVNGNHHLGKSTGRTKQDGEKDAH